MALPLMPKATAVWLVENTALTFTQIATFCGLHELEVQAIADGEIGTNIQGVNPIDSGQLTQQEIDRCQDNTSAKLMLKPQPVKLVRRNKGPRYTPISKRQEKPDAISFLIKNYPELSDAQISKLIGTTKNTITAIRDKSHWNTANIKPKDPVILGLCKQVDLNDAVAKAREANPNFVPPEQEQGAEADAYEAAMEAAPVLGGGYEDNF